MDLSNEKSPKIEQFEFQNWDLYKRSLFLTKEFFQLAVALKESGQKDLADQLRRAISSVPLNLAEGVSRYGLKDKMYFWRISKGSLFECVAIIDLIEILTVIPLNKSKITSEMAEVGKMLSGLIRWAEREQKKG